MTESVRMAELAWPELGERLAGGGPVFLPCGSFEQHGPHLPMSVDMLVPAAIAEAVAARTGGLVAPALAHGYKSMPKTGGGPHFPGTINLDGATLTDLVRDVIRELYRHGARRVCAVVGHYENQWFVTEGIDLVVRELGDPDFSVMRLEYWDFMPREVIEETFPGGFDNIHLEHAAVMETSLMMHLYPDQVRIDRIPDDPPADFPPYDMWPARRDWVPSSGALTSAKAASAEKGRRIMESVVDGIAAAVLKELAARDGK